MLLWHAVVTRDGKEHEMLGLCSVGVFDKGSVLLGSEYFKKLGLGFVRVL